MIKYIFHFAIIHLIFSCAPSEQEKSTRRRNSMASQNKNIKKMDSNDYEKLVAASSSLKFGEHATRDNIDERTLRKKRAKKGFCNGFKINENNEKICPEPCVTYVLRANSEGKVVSSSRDSESSSDSEILCISEEEKEELTGQNLRRQDSMLSDSKMKAQFEAAKDSYRPDLATTIDAKNAGRTEVLRLNDLLKKFAFSPVAASVTTVPDLTFANAGDPNDICNHTAQSLDSGAFFDFYYQSDTYLPTNGSLITDVKNLKEYASHQNLRDSIQTIAITLREGGYGFPVGDDSAEPFKRDLSDQNHCDEYKTFIESITHLDLSGKTIYDLRPLAQFKKLIDLDLSNTKLAERSSGSRVNVIHWQALSKASLPSLRYLKLAGSNLDGADFDTMTDMNRKGQEGGFVLNLSGTKIGGNRVDTIGGALEQGSIVNIKNTCFHEQYEAQNLSRQGIVVIADRDEISEVMPENINDIEKGCATKSTSEIIGSIGDINGNSLSCLGQKTISNTIYTAKHVWKELCTLSGGVTSDIVDYSGTIVTGDPEAGKTTECEKDAEGNCECKYPDTKLDCSPDFSACCCLDHSELATERSNKIKRKQCCWGGDPNTFMCCPGGGNPANDSKCGGKAPGFYNLNTWDPNDMQ